MSTSFKPYTLENEAKGQWCRFEPTDDPDLVHIRFQGACGHVMGNLISVDQAAESTARLLSQGYVEVQEPEGAEPMRFLHDLGR